MNLWMFINVGVQSTLPSFVSLSSLVDIFNFLNTSHCTVGNSR